MSRQRDGSGELAGWLRSASVALGIAASAIGLVGLLGWALEISALTSYLRGALEIIPSVAVAIFLAGLAAVLNATRSVAWGRRCARAAALAVLGVGSISLGKHLSGLDLGIDVLWLSAEVRPMAPGTALALVFVGWASLTAQARDRRLVLSAQVAATACALVALLLVAGYLYGARAFVGVAEFTRMALPSATALATLALANLFLRPDVGLLAIVLRPTPGGALIRRMFLPALLLPALVGGLTLAGYRARLYSLPFAEALALIMNVVLLGCLVWRTAVRLERVDRARREAGVLADASLAIAESLDVAATLSNITRSVVPDLADGAVVHLVGEDNLPIIAAAPAADAAAPSADVAARVRPALEAGANLVHADDHTTVTALRTREGLAAILTLTRDAGRPFADEDTVVIEEVTARAATALEHASLHRDLQQSLALLEILLARAPIGFALLDPDLRFVRVNDALTVLDGVAAPAHLGRRLADVLPGLAPRLGPLLRRVLETAKAVLDQEVTVTPHSSPGSGRSWLTSGYPVHSASGDLLGAGLIVVDVTERKRLLEDTRRMVETQEDILAIVSHDLRSPLNVISLSAHRLVGPSRRPPEHARDTILRAAGRMEKLIADLVDFASIRAGTLSIDQTRLDAVALLDDTIRLLRPAAEAKHIHLFVDAGTAHAVVYCDRNRILQVLANLVGNSIKFTPEGGRIALGLESHGHEVELTVRDTGHGIPQDQQDRVFDRFWKGGGPGAGSGLGLAIAKAIVETHSGRIWVESVLGGGTAMHFTLPAADTPSPSPRTVKPPWPVP